MPVASRFRTVSPEQRQIEGKKRKLGKERDRAGKAKMQGEDEAKVNQPRSDTGMEDEAPAGEELRPRRLAAAAVAAAAADAAEEEGEGEDEDEEYHDAQDDEGDDSNDEYYDVKEVEDSEDDEDEERSRDDESSRLCGVPEVLRRQEERNLRDGDGNNKVLHYDGICHAAMTSKVRKDFATAFEGNPKISVYGSQKPAEPMTAEKAEKSFAEYQNRILPQHGNRVWVQTHQVFERIVRRAHGLVDLLRQRVHAAQIRLVAEQHVPECKRISRTEFVVLFVRVTDERVGRQLLGILSE
jgi:hypothetical protein